MLLHPVFLELAFLSFDVPHFLVPFGFSFLDRIFMDVFLKLDIGSIFGKCFLLFLDNEFILNLLIILQRKLFEEYLLSIHI